MREFLVRGCLRTSQLRGPQESVIGHVSCAGRGLILGAISADLTGVLYTEQNQALLQQTQPPPLQRFEKV
jgi:hypothetical protein